MQELALCPWGARLSPEALALLGSRFCPVSLAQDEVLLSEGETHDRLFLVLEGQLSVATGGQAHILGQAGTGDLLGAVSLVEGRPSATTIRADRPSELLGLSRADIEELAQQRPEILSTLRELAGRHQLAPGARRYRPTTAWILEFLRQIPLFRTLDDHALIDLERQLRWATLLAGETLMVQGGPSSGLYLVVGGRLRATTTDPDGAVPLSHEIRAGEVAGELALVSDERCPATVQAVRDCELLALPRRQVLALIERHPAVMLGLTRTLVARLHTAVASQRAQTAQRSGALNIAVIPIGDAPIGAGSPLDRLTEGLVAEMSGPVRRVSWERFVASGMSTQDLEALADTGHIVLCEVDRDPTPWSRFCLRQADIVLLVGQAGPPPPGSGIEALLHERLALAAPPRVQLVLLHPPETTLPKGTAAWLDRFPVHAHHHVCLERRSDLSRLARLLCGSAVAVVLSGGGARGFAHVGVLRALAEAGVPVDAVGGTSVGAVISAQRALGWDYATMLARNRRGWVESRPMSDYTLPLVSVLSGRRFFAMLEEMFGELLIEDLWIPCFFCTTNLNRGVPEYARRGSLRRWVAASMGFPGLGPPRILRGEFHCDGGILDNLPVPEMRRSLDAHVLAVDVTGGAFTLPPEGVTEFPSSWQVLRRRVFGGPPGPRLPNLLEVLFRAVTIGRERSVEAARAEAALCLCPPVGDFAPFQFEAIETIAQLGYDHAREVLSQRAFP